MTRYRIDTYWIGIGRASTGYFDYDGIPSDDACRNIAANKLPWEDYYSKPHAMTCTASLRAEGGKILREFEMKSK